MEGRFSGLECVSAVWGLGGGMKKAVGRTHELNRGKKGDCVGWRNSEVHLA